MRNKQLRNGLVKDAVKRESATPQGEKSETAALASPARRERIARYFILCFFILIPAASYAHEYGVEMQSLRYSPKTLTLKAGDSVVWKNVSYTDHSASGPGFDTGMVKPKSRSKAVQFSKPGVIAYHCQMHGETMSGVLTVEAK